MSKYYGLTLAAQGVNSSGYYGVTPQPPVQFAQGGATIVPTQTGVVMMNIYPQELQIQAPAGSVSAATTIITDASTIAGTFGVSPPINVALVLTLYGSGGQQIGQSILDPGMPGKPFSFPIPSGVGMSAGDANHFLRDNNKKD
ncbi:MAG TPA: hypothetical protein VJZ00_19110 [Thermoanaerobaculia bacterium]|nr:hypothetical protein [Thermoanaerobaculia bacterium]